MRYIKEKHTSRENREKTKSTKRNYKKKSLYVVYRQRVRKELIDPVFHMIRRRKEKEHNHFNTSLPNKSEAKRS